MSTGQDTFAGLGRDGASSRRFVVLDGLRGIAAFAVILDHVPSQALAVLTQGRYLAVDFFFTLSGFVLAHAYQQRLEQGLGALQFVRLRFIRLYPMYLMGFGIGAVITACLVLTGNAPFSWREVLFISGFSILFLPTPPGLSQSDTLYPFNGPSWTLLFELVANAIYGLFARALSIRVLLLVLPFLALLAALTILREEDLGAGWKWSHAEVGLVRVMYGFLAGVLICKVSVRLRLPAMPAWGAVLLLVLVLCFPAPEAWRRGFDLLACIALMPVIVAVAQGARATGPVAALATRLGILSYGVYVLHQPVFMGLDAFWTLIGWRGVPGALNVFLVGAVAGGMAWAADSLYDAPARALLARYLPLGRRPGL